MVVMSYSGDSSCNSTKGNQVASSCIFYDVTLGDIDVNCTGSHNCYLPSGKNGVLSTSKNSYSKAYGTTSGWDFATGIGTVNASNLLTNGNPPTSAPLPNSGSFVANRLHVEIDIQLCFRYAEI
jgi:hypothetical protein